MLPEQLEQLKREWTGYLDRGQPHLLREALLQAHPADQAEILRDLPDEHIAAVLNVMEDDALRALFRFLRTDTRMRSRTLRALPARRRAGVLGGMNSAAAAEILKGLDASDIEEIIATMPSQKKREIQTAAGTEHKGVELLMTRDALTVRNDKSVRDVMALLHNMSHSEGRPSQIYVTDRRDMLCGMVDLHLLLLAPDPDKPIESIMKECPLRIPHTADPLTASRSLLYYGMGSAPVVNAKNELLGVFTAEAAYRLLEADHDANLNCIGVLSGDTDEIAAEPAVRALRHSLALAPILLAALAASVILRLAVFPDPQPGAGALLPWIPLIIAMNRLYYRHMSLLLQRRSVAQGYGGMHGGRRVAFALLVGALFALAAGAAGWFLNGRHEVFSASLLLGALLAVGTGSLCAWAVFTATERGISPRSVFVTPLALTAGDLAAVSGVIVLFKLIERAGI
jgi:magnesium transporter